MKKLLIFLMIAIPILIILVVNLTVNAVIGSVSIAVERIELDKTEITATVDDIVTLTAKIYPENAKNKEIIWKSDNEEVATVDFNGNVTFVGFGKGYITATTVDGNKVASCYFYATDTKVHQVILSAEKNELHLGDTMQLTATVLPSEALNRRIKFESDNEKVAMVDSDGVVTGLSIGRATISVTTEDGGYTDFVTVLVINPVSELVLDVEHAITGENNYRIGYTILPENATNKIVDFEVDDEGIASVSGTGVVTFKKVGEVNVKLSTRDGNFSKTMKITFTDGYAHSLEFEEKSIVAQFSDPPIYLKYNLLPYNFDSDKVALEFKADNENVVYVDQSGYLSITGGGSTTIRVRAKTDANTTIEETISVFVERPAERIEIEDAILTAQSEIKLNPKSLPADSTNEQYFFHSANEKVATVDENGNVKFLSENANEVYISIFANDDRSVKKDVKVTFTGGKAYTFKLLSKDMQLSYGDTIGLEYDIQPSNIPLSVYDEIKIEIVSSQSANPLNRDQAVIEILPNGRIRAVGGGECEIKVSLQLYNGEVCEYISHISVTRAVEDIEIVLSDGSSNLEKDYDGNFVTGVNTFNFTANILPLDATYQKIDWSFEGPNMGVLNINAKSFTFNSKGDILLFAVCEGFIKEVKVSYTGSYPVSAEVGVKVGEQILPIPEVITFGDSLEIVLKSIFPTNAVNKNLSLSILSQSTSAVNGKVVEIEGNVIKAVGGGKVTIRVQVSTTVYMTYNIEVERQAEEVIVNYENIQTTSQTLVLSAAVYPVDTTNKDVKFILSEESKEVAELSGTTLTFKKNGIVEISIECLSNEGLNRTFTITKVDKEPTKIAPDSGKVTLEVDEIANIDWKSQSGASRSEISIISQSGEVLNLAGDSIIATSKGNAVLKCVIYGNENQIIAEYQIEIEIVVYVKDIEIENDFDVVDGQFVTAVSEHELEFSVSPEEANDKNLKYQITKQIASNGSEETIAEIDENGHLVFTKSGHIILQVTALDNGRSREFEIRYTGGEAIDAELNYDEEIVLEIGEERKIEVESWIPHDTINKNIVLQELSGSSTLQVIHIDKSTNTITAVNGGEREVLVKLSNGLTKIIKVMVNIKATEIVVDREEIFTALSSVKINASVLPNNASIKNLSYSIDKPEIASMQDGIVKFKMAGTVKVTITTIDGSNLSKTITITSTMGEIESIKLNVTNLDLKKLASFQLEVSAYYPTDVDNAEFDFSILEGDDVISLNDGLIRALKGGRAIVRVSAISNAAVYSDCVVTVNSAVESISVNFDNLDEKDKFRGSYTTSRNEIPFIVSLNPQDATNKEYDYLISDPSIASIEENKIIFLKKGNVTITFTSRDKQNGVKSVAYQFNYTGLDILEAAISDEIGFIGNSLTLNAEEEIKLSLKNIVPFDFDREKISYTLNIISEERNDKGKEVIELAGDTIFAKHGGTVNFTLSANGRVVGTFTINVLREAEGIEFGDLMEEDDIISVSNPKYTIKASALPSDVSFSQRRLSFMIVEGEDFASVDSDGIVSFTKTGNAKIKVTVSEKPEVFRYITVSYTTKLIGISFASIQNGKIQTKGYVGNVINFKVLPMPADFKGFEYTAEIICDTENAILERKSNGDYSISMNAPGQVIVRARATDFPEVFLDQTFEFFTEIGGIKLDLNESDDKLGIGQYRVFGGTWLTEVPKNPALGSASSINSYLTNKYTIGYSTQPIAYNNIYWTSNNTKVARVDSSTGEITFVGNGQVTITATVVGQVSGKPDGVSASYTFNVRGGINVSSEEEYMFAHDILKLEQKLGSSSDYTNFGNAIILHKDLKFDTTHFTSSMNVSYNLNISYNLYGNGYMMNMSAIPSEQAYHKIVINTNNVRLDNVHIRGGEVKEALTELQNKGAPLLISGVKNVVIYNSKIEFGMQGIKIERSDVTIQGSIVQETLLSGLVIGRASNVVVRDCIFSHSLLGAILFDEEPDLNVGMSNVTMAGKVLIYNWLDIEELKRGLSGFLDEISIPVGKDVILSYIEKMLLEQTSYIYEKNGKKFCHAGVLNFNLDIVGELHKESKGAVSAISPYTNISLENRKIPGIVLILSIHTLYNDKTVVGGNNIVPEVKYDQSQIDQIKQNLV